MQLLGGRYEPVEVVGRGGQGYVVRAFDHHHGRTVAIKVRKVLPGDGRSSTLREARMLLDLPPHPNIATVRDDFFEGDLHCMVMDWIDGPNLQSALDDATRLPVARVVSYVSAAASALDHLHRQRPPIAHGDVKPANIVIAPGGRAVLVDFGLAALDRGGGGTPGFVAPEVASGAPPTPASDVYSLAAATLALLTGRPPRLGTRPRLRIRSPRDRARVESALSRALSAEPAKRPSAAEFAASLVEDDDQRDRLPHHPSRFFGRRRDISSIVRTIPNERVVTLVGPGGVGKTRLAIESTRAVLGDRSRFPGGAWFIPLANAAADGAVPYIAAAALGLRSGSDPTDAIVTFAAQRGEVLLLVDNCEHVVDGAAALVTAVCAATSRAHVVATSRQQLGIPGERVVAVNPLPPPTAGASEATVRRVDAVRLFADRCAAAAGAPVRFGPSSITAVADLCRRLDGIPLAIELVAARLAPDAAAGNEIAVPEWTDLISHARRSRAAGHPTLDAALRWSTDLLSEDDRAALGRLAVFVGGWTAGASREVAGVDPDAVDRLARASLVTRLAPGRHGMLEVVRQFALADLISADELAEVGERHASWFGALMDAWLQTRDIDEANTLDADQANLDAALRWLMANDLPEAALHIATGLFQHIFVTGRLAFAREWLAATLAAQRWAPMPLRARALSAYSALVKESLDLDAAEAAARESRDLAFRCRNTRAAVHAVTAIGYVHADRGDLTGGLSYYEDAYRLARGLGDVGLDLAAGRLADMGSVYAATGDYARAIEVSEESVALRRRSASIDGLALGLIQVGDVCIRSRDTDRGAAALEEAADLLRTMPHSPRLGMVLEQLARLRLLQGKLDAARDLATEAMRLAQHQESQSSLASSLLTMATIAEEEGDLTESDTLRLRALAGSRSVPGLVVQSLVALVSSPTALDRPDVAVQLIGAITSNTIEAWDMLDRKMPAARLALTQIVGPDRFEALVAEGARLDAASAADLALRSW